jgi:hypothetical protein
MSVQGVVLSKEDAAQHIAVRWDRFNHSLQNANNEQVLENLEVLKLALSTFETLEAEEEKKNPKAWYETYKFKIIALSIKTLIGIAAFCVGAWDLKFQNNNNVNCNRPIPLFAMLCVVAGVSLAYDGATALIETLKQYHKKQRIEDQKAKKEPREIMKRIAENVAQYIKGNEATKTEYLRAITADYSRLPPSWLALNPQIETTLSNLIPRAPQDNEAKKVLRQLSVIRKKHIPDPVPLQPDGKEKGRLQQLNVSPLSTSLTGSSIIRHTHSGPELHTNDPKAKRRSLPAAAFGARYSDERKGTLAETISKADQGKVEPIEKESLNEEKLWKQLMGMTGVNFKGVSVGDLFYENPYHIPGAISAPIVIDDTYVEKDAN